MCACKYKQPNVLQDDRFAEKFKEVVLSPENIARVKYETSSAFRLDESKRPKDDAPLESFRKLNVD